MIDFFIQIKIKHYWFNREELLQKIKGKMSWKKKKVAEYYKKEKVAEYYIANK